VDAVRKATATTKHEPEGGEDVALASLTRTDVLVVGMNPEKVPAGITVQPISPAQRGAWYSLGFMLRGAAAQMLEVQTGEISVGLRALRINDVMSAQVFLSDSLANGAGYCTHLGVPDNFAELVARAGQWAASLDGHGDPGKPCDSACYDCLKDYRNMAYHGLLDWRLAADLLDLLEGHGFDVDKRWADLGHAVMRTFAESFDAEVRGDANLPVATLAERWLISTHPFESADEAGWSDRVAELAAEGRALGAEIVITDHFELLRRPAHVYGRLVE
jgi:hypothetical protein